MNKGALFAVGAGMVSIAVVSAAGIFGSTASERMAARVAGWVRSGVIVPTQTQALMDSIKNAVAGTRFEDRYNLNRPYEAEHINVYTVDPERDPYLRSVKCNCAAFRDAATIVCDHRFVTRFRNMMTGDPTTEIPPSPKSVIEEEEDALRARFPRDFPQRYPIKKDFFPTLAAPFQQFLADWLIAHEVGHIINGIVKNGDISAGQLRALRNQFPGQEEELVADLNYLARLTTPQQRTRAHLALSLAISGVLDSYPNRVDPLFPQRRAIYVPYPRGPHPAFLVRLLNLAKALITVFPEVDGTDYFDRLRQEIVLDPSIQTERLAICEQQ
jgi:hypothetical protein